MKRLFTALLLLPLTLTPTFGKPAKTAKVPLPVPQEIVLRHALSGAPLEALATLVMRFNDAEARRKAGSGRIVLQDLKGVEDKTHLPHLAIFDYDEELAMFGTRPRFLPLHRVMAADGRRFDEKIFYPQMADAVDDLSGRMQALPIGMSLPVLFYDKTAFLKAKLDPDNPPKTWWELQEAAGALREAGYTCPLTSSRFAWVHVENVAAQHGEPLMTKNGKQHQLALNNMVNVKHLALLTSWYKSFYFEYSGRGREGDERFMRGECAMLTSESALHTRLLRERPDFPFGVTVLPYYDDVYGARPAQVLPDGAALWVLAADKKPQRQVIARFIEFLLQPEVQREWVRSTGFLPMTAVALPALREAGTAEPVLALVEKRLAMPKRDTARTRIGFGKSRIRNILNEEIEFVWGNQKPAKEALDTAVARSMLVLGPASARTVKR